ncbi:MAG: sigma 54-interacting transcriptional regulator, partial [Agathobaculum sp.]|jgi:transcriptional regulator with GAF, ATPase, and Fis domain|uniref:sigma 54-interacting transcriptional regulator n=1 Tax=Agathobaculum sp. TaxID=2048138 RepID=UPI003D8A0649
VDVRIICATNKNLPQMVAEGRFREDLYYRLKVLTLQVPPLRARKQDIPVIFESIAGQPIPPSLKTRFLQYDWPGNIRELRAIVQHFTVLAGMPETDGSRERIWNRILDNFFSTPAAAAPETEPELREETGAADEPLSADDLALLACIDELCREGQSAGRYSLARHPEMLRRGLTEARIKPRLSQLKARGYLLAGRTRQGVALSERGCAALENME